MTTPRPEHGSRDAAVLIGAHVRAGGDLLPALRRGAQIGADVVQIFTQSPRAWKPTQYSEEELAAYRDAQAHHPSVVATFCHATYLINLAAPDGEVAARSRACLEANFAVAGAIGARGLVLHVGSHRGAGFGTMLAQVVDALVATVSTPAAGDCLLVLENAAGAGDTVGRTFDELAAIIEGVGRAGGPDAAARVGVCLDTQHLWASGVDYGSLAKADAVVDRFESVVGAGRLVCLHLNDSKVALGANRDRHANIGQGTIGASALGGLVSHPALSGVPAILETPGASGRGAEAADLDAARAAVAGGAARRRRRERARRRPKLAS